MREELEERIFAGSGIRLGDSRHGACGKACDPIRREDRRDGRDCLFSFDSVTDSQSVGKSISRRQLCC